VHYNIQLFALELDRLLLALNTHNSGFVCLMGDVNAPDPNNEGEVHPAAINVLMKYGLHQWVDKPTRGKRLLDIMASPNNQRVSGVDVVEPLGAGSDHID
jgi:hypothetical protein